MNDAIKSVLRTVLINALAIWLASRLIPGFTVPLSEQSIITAAVILSIMEKLIRPVIKLVLLPLSFITFGLTNWLISAALIYGLAFIVPEIHLEHFRFHGFSYEGIVLSARDLNIIVVTILTALVIKLTQSFLMWLFK